MNNFLVFTAELIDKWIWLIKLGGIITGITLIITALRSLYKQAYIPLKAFIFEIKENIEEFNKAYPVLEKMSKDFKPNGGNSLRDVVDRIEKKLYLFEQKYRAVVEFQDIGMFETDEHGRYTWVSEKWLEITHQSWMDASNNGWIARISSDDRDKVWHEWETAVQQTRQFSMKYRIHDLPNGVKTIISMAIPVKDKDGKVLAYLGKIKSISPQGYTEGGKYEG